MSEKTCVLAHYWSVYHPTSIPLITFKTKTGEFVRGTTNFGTLPASVTPCEEPKPFTGYSPETHEYGFVFGEWRSVAGWKRGETAGEGVTA